MIDYLTIKFGVLVSDKCHWGKLEVGRCWESTCARLLEEDKEIERLREEIIRFRKRSKQA